MTDLKTANEQLAQALKALESPEHDTDVREAEACRNRLMELDERIGARIKAKLEAHKAIADCWGQDLILGRPESLQRAEAEGRILWGTERIEGSVLGAPVVLPPGVSVEAPLDGLTADAWEKHHEEHTGKYALSGEEIPDPVLVNGVAEMQQAETVTES